jgi:FKBP-type peptidyl-prolyl cis-trans isomerase
MSLTPKKMKTTAMVLVILSVCLLACQQTEEVFQVKKTEENKSEIRKYITTNRLTADSTKSGLFYYFQKLNASGQKPVASDEIVIQYVATRFDGVVVDSTTKAEPYTFIRVPGASLKQYRFEPVPALEELMQTTVEKLHAGDQITLLVPWSLRTSGSGTLRSPLYIPLRYDLKILSVRTEDQQMTDFISNRKLSVTEKTTDGLRFIRTLARPDSAVIAVGTEVTVKYTGRFVSNGTTFDSGSLNVTVVDPTGTRGGSVVKGFNDGIAKMRFGEKAFIVFPSALGYGTTGKGTIPAYAPLSFEIEVSKKL